MSPHPLVGVDRLLIRPARYARSALVVGVGQIKPKTHEVSQIVGHDTTTSSQPEDLKGHPPYSHSQIVCVRVWVHGFLAG